MLISALELTFPQPSLVRKSALPVKSDRLKTLATTVGPGSGFESGPEGFHLRFPLDCLGSHRRGLRCKEVEVVDNTVHAGTGFNLSDTCERLFCHGTGKSQNNRPVTAEILGITQMYASKRRVRGVCCQSTKRHQNSRLIQFDRSWSG